LTVSQSSAESLERHHGWRDVSVIPEGYTPHPVPPVVKEAEPTIAFLGRLVAMKRPEDAIAAFGLLRRTFGSARLWMIGDGPRLARLRHNASPGVEFLGRLSRDDVLDRLARAHVLVATSVREGWGLNVSEAAACGTPTIGYSVAGLVDSIPASGGALVEPKAELLGKALINFFSGGLDLQPRISTVPWPDVAAMVERRLVEVAAARR
jgi:glycosyltransferase involved in cell wall biosynthesis